jgi:hypothetical protein
MSRFCLAAVSLFVLLSGIAVAATPAPVSVRIAPGTYRQIDTVTKQALEVGSQIVIIAGKAGRLGFSLNAVRQVDMNQGFVVGLLPAAPPLTWSRTASSGNCRLTFEPLPNSLKVTQDVGFGDCGFGYGVTANGTYGLVAEKPLKP